MSRHTNELKVVELRYQSQVKEAEMRAQHAAMDSSLLRKQLEASEAKMSAARQGGCKGCAIA